MEDILASIRKIIAEEPNPAKPSAVARTGAAGSAEAAALAPARAVASAPSAQTPAPVVPVSSRRLSDVVRALAPSAVPVGPGAGLAIEDDFADLVEAPAGFAAPGTALLVAAAPVAVPALGAGQAEPLVPTVRAAIAADATPLMPSDRSSTFTFGENALPANARPAAAAAPAIAIPSAGRALAANTSERKSMDFGAFVPGSPFGFATPRPLPASITADLHATDSAKAPARVQRPEPGLPALSALLHAGMPANGEALATADTAADAAQSALGALAAGLAAPEPPSAAGMTTSKGSLDDQIVAMIRPMVRDWLDANLPGMVERTLAGEIKRREHGATIENCALD